MTNKFSNIKERVLYLAEIQEGNKQVFFKKIGVTYGNFTGKAKETPLNSNAIENILLNYPDTNLYWLISGIGDPIINTLENNVEKPVKMDNNDKRQSIFIFSKLGDNIHKLEIICAAIDEFTDYRFHSRELNLLNNIRKTYDGIREDLFIKNRVHNSEDQDYYNNILKLSESRTNYYLFVLSKYTGKLIEDFDELKEKDNYQSTSKSFS